LSRVVYILIQLFIRTSPASVFSSYLDIISRHPHRETLSANTLEIRHPPVITPIPCAPPPQRLVLRPAHLARLGVLLPFKLGRRALAHPRAQRSRRDLFFYFLCLRLYRRRRRCTRRRGDVPRRGQRDLGVVYWDVVVRGEGGFGGALETLEFGLLVGGQARGGGCGLEKGGGGCQAVRCQAVRCQTVRYGGGFGERAEGAEGTEVAGHFCGGLAISVRFCRGAPASGVRELAVRVIGW
jgi:hypothetical protein